VVDLVILQSVSYVAAAIGVVLAAVNYVITSRREEKRSQQTLETRQAQMFMNIYQQVTSKDYIQAMNKAFEDTQWSTWEELQDHWKDKEFREAFNVIGTYYEGLGVLVREGFLNIRLVALLICGSTLRYWGKLGPIVMDARKGMAYSRFASESEYLYDELVKYLKEHPELQTDAYKGYMDWVKPQ
jgi:hypothetical protein